MPLANGHSIPNCIWHITYRYHKQKFLLKFDKDKKRLRIRDISHIFKDTGSAPD